MAQLQIAEMWDKQVVKLQFDERCASPAGGSTDPNDWRALSGYFHGSDR